MTDASGNYQEKNVDVHYNKGNNTISDSTAPSITLNVINVEQGTANFTRLEYSAEDDSTITYMNVYEKKNGKYELLRTKFCYKQSSCSSFYDRTRLTEPTTFLVVAVDIYGNHGQFEQEFLAG